MPVYLIEITETIQKIVVADIVSQAVRHATKGAIKTTTLTAEGLAKHVAAGVQIEIAEGKPDPIVPAIHGEPFAHKAACGASGTVPIGGPGCRCTEMGLE